MIPTTQIDGQTKIAPWLPQAPSPCSAKKVHSIWCNVFLTLLLSAKFCKSRVEKTRKDRPKSTFSGPFMAKSATFFRPRRARILACLCPRSLSGSTATGPRRWSGLVPASKVCIPYGRGMEKGMRPSPNSFAIKYGGMPYRGEGAAKKKMINRRQMRRSSSNRPISPACRLADSLTC